MILTATAVAYRCIGLHWIAYCWVVPDTWHTGGIAIGRAQVQRQELELKMQARVQHNDNEAFFELFESHTNLKKVARIIHLTRWTPTRRPRACLITMAPAFWRHPPGREGKMAVRLGFLGFLGFLGLAVGGRQAGGVTSSHWSPDSVLLWACESGIWGFRCCGPASSAPASSASCSGVPP